MIEIEPIIPYKETVQFPSIDANGDIVLTDAPATEEFVYTAGPVLDDSILDEPIPFRGFRGSYPPGERSIGFMVTRLGDSYLIPEVVQRYEMVVAQLLGALSFVSDPVEEFTHYYSFGISEMALATSGFGIHPDGQGIDDFETAAITSSCFPTLYLLGQEPEDREFIWHDGTDPKQLDPNRLWCPEPRSITVHTGQMLHGTAIIPPGTTGTRRLADVRHSGNSVHPMVVSRIEIDDQFVTLSDADDLLIR